MIIYLDHCLVVFAREVGNQRPLIILNLKIKNQMLVILLYTCLQLLMLMYWSFSFKILAWFVSDAVDFNVGACRYDSSLGEFTRVTVLQICWFISRLCASVIWFQLGWVYFLKKNFVLSLTGLLTKKFVNLIHADKDGIIDLNKAAVILNVWFSWCLDSLIF